MKGILLLTGAIIEVFRFIALLSIFFYLYIGNKPEATFYMIAFLVAGNIHSGIDKAIKKKED